MPPPGNSVPRYHFVRNQGLGLVMPVYRAVLEEPAVRFAFNTRADELLRENGRVVGVRATDLRTGEVTEETLPQSNVLALLFEDGDRVLARPSGTEPKIKFYFEVRVQMEPDDTLASARERARGRIEALVHGDNYLVCIARFMVDCFIEQLLLHRWRRHHQTV